jgi:uncharacterized protein (TIGR02118 family)
MVDLVDRVSKEVGSMVKAVSFIRRKPGTRLEDFMEHYESVHAPLAMRHFPLKKYSRNYITAPPGLEGFDFDCITEVWFETMEDCQAAAEFSVSEAYKVISDDEETFMDRTSIVAFLVEERETLR